MKNIDQLIVVNINNPLNEDFEGLVNTKNEPIKDDLIEEHAYSAFENLKKDAMDKLNYKYYIFNSFRSIETQSSLWFYRMANELKYKEIQYSCQRIQNTIQNFFPKLKISFGEYLPKYLLKLSMHDFEKKNKKNVLKWYDEVISNLNRSGVSISQNQIFNESLKLVRRELKAFFSKDYDNISFEKTFDSFGIQIPKCSEHGTGLAIDISIENKEIGMPQSEDETNWLMKNCSDYGFILRYPNFETKRVFTGIKPEAWHYRYVGSKKTATEIMYFDLTLEEYRIAIDIIESNLLKELFTNNFTNSNYNQIIAKYVGVQSLNEIQKDPSLMNDIKKFIIMKLIFNNILNNNLDYFNDKTFADDVEWYIKSKNLDRCIEDLHKYISCLQEYMIKWQSFNIDESVKNLHR